MHASGSFYRTCLYCFEASTCHLSSQRAFVLCHVLFPVLVRVILDNRLVQLTFDFSVGSYKDRNGKLCSVVEVESNGRHCRVENATLIVSVIWIGNGFLVTMPSLQHSYRTSRYILTSEEAREGGIAHGGIAHGDVDQGLMRTTISEPEMLKRVTHFYYYYYYYHCYSYYYYSHLIMIHCISIFKYTHTYIHCLCHSSSVSRSVWGGHLIHQLVKGRNSSAAVRIQKRKKKGRHYNGCIDFHAMDSLNNPYRMWQHWVTHTHAEDNNEPPHKWLACNNNKLFDLCVFNKSMLSFHVPILLLLWACALVEDHDCL